jgi:hypothetical protein
MMKAAPEVSVPKPAHSWVFIGLAASALLAAGFAAAWLTLKESPRPRSIATAAPEAEGDQRGSPPRREKERWLPPRFLAGAPNGERPPRIRPSKRMRNQGEEATEQSWAPGPPGRDENAVEGTPSTPDVIARERTLRKTLEGLRASNPDVEIRFANCSGGNCVGQVQSTQAAAIDRFAADAQRLAPAGFQVRVRERLTAFNGRLWEAEVIAPSDRVPQSANP